MSDISIKEIKVWNLKVQQNKISQQHTLKCESDASNLIPISIQYPDYYSNKGTNTKSSSTTKEQQIALEEQFEIGPLRNTPRDMRLPGGMEWIWRGGNQVMKGGTRLTSCGLGQNRIPWYQKSNRWYQSRVRFPVPAGRWCWCIKGRGSGKYWVDRKNQILSGRAKRGVLIYLSWSLGIIVLFYSLN